MRPPVSFLAGTLVLCAGLALPAAELEAQSPDTFHSLRAIAPALKRLPPLEAGSFDPAGAWTLTFDTYVLKAPLPPGAGEPPGGGLILKRKPSTNGFELRILSRRVLVGPREFRQKGTMRCRTNALASPLAWSWSFEMHFRGRPIDEDVWLTRSARLADGVLHVDGLPRVRSVRLEGPVTTDWSLLEAVGRLPNAATEVRTFTRIDDFDLVKPHHSLAFIEKVNLALPAMSDGSGPANLRCHVYRCVGDGALPTTYWVTDRGLLFCVHAGMTSHLLRRWEPRADPAAPAGRERSP